ncbi:MAG TPA: GNAT family N-acetyltransferase [Stellaceae bacterium]|nr:GNAT family N-acetyltransferase [Stellaceae bacterium]
MFDFEESKNERAIPGVIRRRREGANRMQDTPIELERLLLRRPKLEDAEIMHHSWANDTEVTKYLIWRPHKSLQETLSYLKFVSESWDNGTEFTWMICLKQSSQPIGTISLRPEGFKAGMGYALSRHSWGNGFVFEAARKIIDLAFLHPQMYRVGGFCDVENSRSARVMEKLGMQLEGTLKNWLIHPALGDRPRDCFSYSVTAHGARGQA